MSTKDGSDGFDLPTSVSKHFERLTGFDFLDAIGFDSAAYLDFHPDLASLDLSHFDAKAHYLAHGAYERRRASFTSDLAQVRDALQSSRLTKCQQEVLSRSLASSKMMQLNRLEQIPDALVGGIGYEPVLVCGDSHISLFTRENYKERDGLIFVPFCCWGGSARGLPKLISRLNYGTTILSVLKASLASLRASGAPLLFMFGQNDVEFVYHFKRASEGASHYDPSHFEAYVEETVKLFMLFMQQVREVVGGQTKIILSGIMPPTLSDEHMFGNQKATLDLAWAADVDNFDSLKGLLSGLEVPDWRERTAMHQRYNRRLANHCENHQYYFLDVYNLALSADGTVAEPFIRGQNGKDHHLDFYSFYTDLLSGQACRELHRILQNSMSAFSH